MDGLQPLDHFSCLECQPSPVITLSSRQTEKPLINCIQLHQITNILSDLCWNLPRSVRCDLLAHLIIETISYFQDCLTRRRTKCSVQNVVVKLIWNLAAKIAFVFTPLVSVVITWFSVNCLRLYSHPLHCLDSSLQISNFPFNLVVFCGYFVAIRFKVLI